MPSPIGRVEKDAQGKLAGMRGINLDVTERMITEMALLQSEAGLAEAQRLAKIGSWSLDVTTEEIRWSKEMFRIFEIDGIQLIFIIPCRSYTSTRHKCGYPKPDPRSKNCQNKARRLHPLQ